MRTINELNFYVKPTLLPLSHPLL